MHIEIWIVEDDNNFSFLLESMLSTIRSDIRIRVYEVGEEALRAPGVPDIVYADTNLAGKLTGPEVVKELRQRNPDLSVVFCSSTGIPSRTTLIARDHILPKPFTVAALLKQAQRVIAEIPRLQIPPLHHKHTPHHHHAHHRRHKRL